MVVKVTARQWSWTFDYENGKETSVLMVPVRKPVKLLITSTDVLHSLYIPAYRIKEDCVPGMETHLWFLPDELGSYDLFCTEYCGVGHSDMISKVEVMSQKDFNAWYKSGTKIATAGVKTKGKPFPESDKLLQNKGCIACHSMDGTTKIGPTFKGLYGRKVIVMTAGSERDIIADDEYVKRSIKDPKADVVKGFQPIMPVLQLSDDEINEIIEYFKTLK
jgi:cytochrome c oxidase subunit 2